MIVMAFLFLAVLLAGVPVFIALAGSSFIYTHFIAELPDFVILHRMAGGIGSFPLLAVAFFFFPRQLVQSARLTTPPHDFPAALAGRAPPPAAPLHLLTPPLFLPPSRA